MALTNPILVLCLLLPKVNAIQTSLAQRDVISQPSPAGNVSRIFVSANGLWCGQAPSHIAEDALSLYKSMPRGKLYEGISVKDDGNCEQLGYTLSTGEDPCYPGLQTYHRNEDEQNKFVNDLRMAVRKHGEFGVDVEDPQLIDSCSCKDGSVAKNFRGSSCKQAMYAIGQKATFVSANNKLCVEARKRIAKKALVLYKSMPRARLYDGVLLSNVSSCKQLGYHWYSGEDSCFPGLRTFYRNGKEQKQFMIEFQTILTEFGETYDFSVEDTKLMDSCNCKDGSIAKNYLGAACDNMSAPQDLFKMPSKRKQKQRASRTFVSVNKLWCAQAPKRIAAGAQALYKAMPRGTLYEDTNHFKTCEQLGYNLSAGEDPCYPGLQTFYRNEDEEKQFYSVYEQALKEYGDRYNLTSENVELMDSCTCHTDSVALKYRRRSCNLLKTLEASWIHRDHTGKENACVGGPFVLSTRALAVLKYTEHQSDQIMPVECDKLGFPFRATQQSNCFTGLRFWSNETHSNIDLLNMENASCQCAPNSEFGKKVEESCHERRNHIRDWWKE